MSENGQQYGPADLPTLQLWSAEGRIAPHTMLVEEGTGRQMAASIVLSQQYAPPPQPMASFAQYPREPYGFPVGATDDGTSDVNASYICSVLGLLVCGFAVIGGIVFANRAIAKGNPRGNGARTFAIVMLALWVLLLFAFCGLGGLAGSIPGG